jgi:proline iminopeptidase
VFASWGSTLPVGEPDGSLVEAQSGLLADPGPAVRAQAARDWCAWENAHVRVRPDHGHDPCYDDPAFRMAFARLVTHYWRHAAWLEDGVLLRDAGRLAGIPGVLVHGRLDISSPLDVAWELSRAWPGSSLVIVDEAGHSAGDRGMAAALVAATDGFAARTR